MLWLIVTLISYFILAIVYLIDRYLLTSQNRIPSPQLYTFYVGLLATVIVVIAPFIHFYIPPLSHLLLSLVAGAFFTISLLFFYKGLNLFEASRIIPAEGALIPIFSFLLINLFSGGQEKMSSFALYSFILLLFGTFLITYEKEKKITWKSFQIATLVAFFCSLSFVLSKYVYLKQPFLNALIWIKLGGALPSLALLIFSKEVRKGLKETFNKNNLSSSKKTLAIFVSNQISGGIAGLLQQWAFSLAPLIYLPIINALQGVQYLFLLIFVVLLSWRLPNILKETVTRSVLLQKIIAIILIGVGLALLALK
ncbi:MAG: hypothetical protein ACPLKV_00625 [Minisyncoccia bacterium]